jgi:dTDP-4-amino-4,6-dideoxygalactose transaminase
MKNLERIFLSPPHMGGEELKFIQEAFESNYIAPLGPMVDAFEREFTEKVGIPYAAALSSGTAAMHLALRILGIGLGDEVIASTLTFIGGVTPIMFQGAMPVFIDSDSSSWTMDPELLADELEACKKCGKLPKAVVPTDLYGSCADSDRIMGICNSYDIPVVTDSAEALGAKRRLKAQSSKLKGENMEVHAGVGARAAIFSFNGIRLLPPRAEVCWHLMIRH